ncbi:DUF1269 domain-containing protein [Citricoccus sp.]|uniref:DUF1269 domain-containing protein n=1 Tax=Citricoccus sp. TaxID=1978372 RepID=UPI0028BD7D1B|nr:DUF1269 domain-containing protein [Citricoccus sp.]
MLVATLSVWKFNDASEAEQAEQTLLNLQTQELIRVHDAAAVSWPADAKKPKTSQLHKVKGAGALGGTFWGLLFGTIFFVPLIGAAVGAAAGTLTGALTDVGIDDSFIKRVRDKVTPGTSALFVLTTGAVTERVAEAFRGTEMELLETNLSHSEEEALRAVFASDESAVESSPGANS